MKKLRVGIVGLGAITQLVYLPDFDMLKDKYEITALCDASPGVLKEVGGKNPGARLCASTEELSALDCVDAVLIANTDAFHYTDTLCAIRCGKHVYVEKPMCHNEGEARAIIAAAKEKGVQVMVAYVRRYSDAFDAAKREVDGLGQINYARIRDMLGYNFLFMMENSAVVRYDDIPTELKQKRDALMRESLTPVLGEDYTEQQRGFYQYMTGLCCHDFSAMRGILGMPRGVLSAATSGNGNFLSVVFDYGGFCAAYEVGIDSQKRRDSALEFFSENKTVKLEYGCFYYLKQMPDSLQIDECKDGVFTQSHIVPTYRNPYVRELEAFYEAIVNDAPIATPPEDYLEDLQLFGMILEKMKEKRA